jgi:hypothetical protein
MDSVNLKNNMLAIGQKKSCHLAERIYRMLNQGNLFEIHKILQDLKNEEEMKCVVQVFLEKFNFNFQKYI